MNVDQVLLMLDKVSAKGDNAWLACCPAHEDKSPSLGITDRDGTILFRCFAGCKFEDIIGALGIEASDMFPEKTSGVTTVTDKWGYEKTVVSGKPIKNAFPDKLVLEALTEEVIVMEIGLAAMAEGKILNSHQMQRMGKAANLFHAARVAGGRT